MALAAAILLYGGLSSPTPDAPGRVEAAIGLLLILAVGPVGAAAAAFGAGLRPTAPLGRLGPPLLAGLLWPPLVLGLARGWSAQDIVRDVLPLFYLFLPVLLAHRLPPHRAVTAPAALLATLGVLLAARFLAIVGAPALGLALPPPDDGQLYLANSPAVLFAAVLLPLLALDRGRPTPAGLLRRLACAAGGLLALAALAVSLQRAALTLAGLGLAGGLLRAARRGPSGGLPVLCAGVVGLIGGGEWLVRLVTLLAEKTRLSGFNQHMGEVAAAGLAVGGAPETVLLGLGWGALIDSPAVPGIPVSFLHALPLYILVKAGLLGLGLLALYLAALTPGLRALGRRHPAIALAALPALTIGLLVQPTFKWLDFGLLLALPALALAEKRAAR